MSMVMDEDVKKWTARRKSALVLENTQAKPTITDAARSYDVARSEIGEWVDQGKAGMDNVLSDYGSAYIAADTADTASALGLKLAFKPVRSPESNGISESFVKTFRRDYLSHNILTDAETLLNLLPRWFNEHNEVHPHSGLRFLSPREFRRRSA